MNQTWRLPRRINLLCLYVGSTVVAWEALEDAASERVDVVALQEIKLRVSGHKRFDIRAC